MQFKQISKANRTLFQKSDREILLAIDRKLNFKNRKLES